MRQLTTFFTAAATVLLGAAICAQPAQANTLVDGTLAADCSGYTVTASATSLDQGISYVADYALTLHCSVAPASASAAGSFAVTLDPPPNASGTGSGSSMKQPWGTSLNGACTAGGTVTLTSSGSMVNLPLASFSCGPPPPCMGAIGDFVWNDLNNNGIQDAGEPGINGVVLSLTYPDGTIKTTTTGNSPSGTPGYYQFTGLCAGNYTVTVDQSTLPPGDSPTGCGVGGNGALDSNCSGGVTLTTDSSTDETIDFGYVSPTPPCAGAIGDFVWNDLNHNGIQDAGEPGINGVVLSLTYPDGTIKTATTGNSPSGSAGYYQFTGLCAGDYAVAVNPSTVPPGLTPTACGLGGNPALDSNCSGAVTLSGSSTTDETIDFGFSASGKTFTIGPSSMEGHLTISAGDWVSGGYSFAFKNGSHAATNFVVAATVTVPVTCPKGGGAGGNIVVDLGTKNYAVPAGNTNWLPTGDQNSVLSWMGAVQAPNLCGGNPMDNAIGAIYKATVSQNPPTGSLVNFRFKYRDPNAKGKGNVNCLDTSNPLRAKADVCGASWSQTVTDP